MILYDTGPLVATAVASEADHHACVELLTGLRLANRRLMLPATVLAEVGYMLQRELGPVEEAIFVRGVALGDFELVQLMSADLERMAELMTRYSDLPLGTTDASVIAVAERLDIREIATLDRRHFSVVRPRHVEALTVLPEIA